MTLYLKYFCNPCTRKWPYGMMCPSCATCRRKEKWIAHNIAKHIPRPLLPSLALHATSRITFLLFVVSFILNRIQLKPFAIRSMCMRCFFNVVFATTNTALPKPHQHHTHVPFRLSRCVIFSRPFFFVVACNARTIFSVLLLTPHTHQHRSQICALANRGAWLGAVVVSL